MGRRERRTKTDILVRIDLSELDINNVLLEDLRYYVGSPKVYVPKIWDVCINVLREENRIVLTNRDNAETLDDVWEGFYDDFSERKFKRIIAERNLSVRMDGYKDSVTHFYFDIFEIMYPQVARSVDKLVRQNTNAEMCNYSCEVTNCDYDFVDDGFGQVKREVGVTVKVKTENMLTTNLLRGDGYGL